MRRALIALAVFAVLAGPAQAARVSVIVIPPDDPFPAEGAHGLLIPGSGETVSGEGALAALVRGETEPAVLGGVPSGPPLISLSTQPSEVTVYVSLPPDGTHPNTRRYPIAVVGGGFDGSLRSSSTRIPGLVSIADVAPFALRGGRLRDGPEVDLAALDRKLRQQDDAWNWAVGLLAFGVILGSVIALATRSRFAVLAALTLAPALLLVSMILAAFGGGRPIVIVPLLGAIAVGVSLLGGLLGRPSRLAVLSTAMLVAILAILVFRPEWAALAALGPNVAKGGRFFGLSNVASTLLLAAVVFACASLPRRQSIAVAVLAVVTIGWSKAGADGGGLLVFAAALIVLYAAPLTRRRLGIALALVVPLGLVAVGLDAALGGRSHVTRTISDGPGAILDEVGHRLQVSGERIAAGWHPALVFAIGLGAIAVMVARGPRFRAGDALLVGIAVSLLVNDSPTQIAAAAGVSYGVLWAWQRVDSNPCAGEL